MAKSERHDTPSTYKNKQDPSKRNILVESIKDQLIFNLNKTKRFVSKNGIWNFKKDKNKQNVREDHLDQRGVWRPTRPNFPWPDAVAEHWPCCVVAPQDYY
jgi:hypothetical protein